MLDQGSMEIDETEKREILRDQTKRNRREQEIGEDVELFLNEHQEVFAVSEKELHQTKLVKMSIDTGNHEPIKQKTRPVPLGLRQKLKEMLKDLENRRIIESSNSDWAFPIVLVETKDGNIRLCVDYREINNCIKQDSYPIPTINTILESLAGKKWFSTLDMCSGYWQIPIDEESKHKSAFTTQKDFSNSA